jgi:hypothetical protein
VHWKYLQLRRGCEYPPNSCWSCFQTWTLGTRFHIMGEVLISHVDQQGPLGQIPNIWVEVERELLAACVMQEDWNVNSICMWHTGMQKRVYRQATCIYGHVKKEKIVLGRTGSPTGLGHLQLWIFHHFYFSLL